MIERSKTSFSAELAVLLASQELAQGQQPFVATLRAEPESRLLTQVGAVSGSGERGQHFGCLGRRMHAQGNQTLLHCPAARSSGVAKCGGALGKLAEKCGTVFRLHIRQPLKRYSAGIEGASCPSHTRPRDLAVVKPEKHHRP